MEVSQNLALPWEILAAAALAVGLVIALFNRWMSWKVLAKVSTWPLCSPNWITFWSVIVFYIGFGFYLAGYLFMGFVIMVIGGAMDLLDGQMAKAMIKFGIPRSLLSIERGEWGDPFADKLRQLNVIAFMIIVGVFNPVLAVAVIAVDVFGTFVRKPFTKYKAFLPVKKHLRQSKASSIGKAKTLFQVFALIAAVPYHQKWVSPGYIPDVILGIALVLGVFSVISRIKISREVDQAVDEVHAVFDAESSN
jgi:phosphatidylglycerophosphate synthase